MTPDQLKAALRAGGAALDLDVAALGSALLSAHLGERFTLGAVTGRTELANGMTVTGTGASGPFTGLAVTATFTADGSAVTADITGTGDETWTFVTAYPVLKATLFETLRFRRPVLHLTPSGLAFTGTLIITTPMAPLDLMMPGAVHAVTGEIEMVTEIEGLGLDITPVPDIVLYGPEGHTLDLGLVTLTGLRYEIFADPWLNYATGDMDPRGRVALTGAIPFTASGTTHQVLIGADIMGWGESLVLKADLGELGEAAFEEIVAFLGQDSLDIPVDLEVTAPVVPRDLTVRVTPKATRMVSHVSLTLQTSHEWDLDLFVVQAVDLTFRVDDPLGDARVTVAVAGLFGIGEHGTLEITAGAGDSLALGGALREGDPPLNIREVWQEFTNETGATHLPDLKVEHFDLSVRLPSGAIPLTASGVLEVDGQWEIVEGVMLEDLRFAFDIQDDITFASSAALLVSSVGVYVSATYDAVKGWEFEGGSRPGQQLPIGEMIDSLSARFGAPPLPAPLAGLTVHDLAASFATKPVRFLFTAGMRFPIDTTEVDLAVAIDTRAGTYDGAIAVLVRPGLELDFGVHFAQQAGANRFAATYRRGGTAPTVRELVAALVPSAAADVPDDIVVGVDDALLAVEGDTHVFEVDLTAKVDLSKLPVVGPRLTGDQVVGFDPLRILATTGTLTPEQVTALNAILPPDAAKLESKEYPPGFAFSGHLRLGPLERAVTLPVGTPPQVTPTQAKTADDVLWYKAQTDFGPVHVERVGLAYEHVPDRPARLAVLVDASISAGGLTLACDGLSAGVSLSNPTALPTFDLAGLAVSYSGGPVKVSGAFLKNTVTYEGKSLPAYSGKAVIETDAFTVGALGSYMQLPEGPSLFVYAFLDYPIGGPAFFFVEGIAAGFGYNRRIVAPPVEKIADFPLVAEAVGAVLPGTLATELSRLEDDLPPSPGDFFLAAGIHFTSFKMIDSFLLVTAQFGHRFEMNVLGLSTLVLPVADAAQAGVTPIAEIQLALKATFAPEDGYFSLLAQLTSNSYLLSRACRLTGGFAFVTWFGEEHQGDFVLSVGGYHPNFTVPAHYPAVPRLGFSWQVTPQLSMKGSAYYALTPGALMAGAALSAVYEDGSLRAWFDAAVDFLIAWQPYHYEAGLHIAVGASYTFTFLGTHTITAHVGTDVRFWGPEFGGTATIDLDVISFTISFGSSSGASAEPVPWSRFRTAQLPKTTDGVTVVLRGGSPKDSSGTHLGTVSPAELELLVDSAVPATSATSAGTALATTGAAPFGIAPVGAAPGTFTSTQTITITRGKDTANSAFRFDPVGKSLPAALWGDQLTPSLGKPALRDNLLTGYVIRPNPPREPATTQSLPLSRLKAATSLSSDPAFSWTALPAFRRATGQALNLAAGAQARSAIAGKLLPDLRVDLNGLGATDFLQAPEVGSYG
ncbi:hypothetical protein GCM10022252_49400 [Streptosporangium oxazolinicum]|uniref:DUF6603 domain-containing protein n=1 Tax=Streptosporangium oxazolinicum TaxID=909287 RepID=A0ABP8B630_9ACTN